MHFKKRFFVPFILIISCYTLFSQNVPPSQSPPGGLNPKAVPQFVVIGFDDNAYSGLEGTNGTGGMIWATDFFKDLVNPPGKGNADTYDGTPGRVSFYNTAIYIGKWMSESPTFVKKSWRTAFEDGHEMGVHSYNHPHGSEYNQGQWENEINQCISWLTKEFNPDEVGFEPDSTKGVGVEKSEIRGFRTPFLECNDPTFAAVAKAGLTYDCSIEDGYQDSHDGTNYYWPYTLDNGGSDGWDVLIEISTNNPAVPNKRPLNNHPGLWIIPNSPVIVPPDDKCSEYGVNYSIRQKMKGIHDWFDENSGKITGFDYNLWVKGGGGYEMTKDEFTATLKYTLDLRYNNNRAPFMFGAHSDYYNSKYDGPPTNVESRQDAVEEFITYALKKSDVRVVPASKIIDWCKNPVGLGGTVAKNKNAPLLKDNISTYYQSGTLYAKMPKGSFSITFYSTRGQQIHATLSGYSTGDTQTFQLDKRNFCDGFYLLHVQQPVGNIVRKIIITH